MNFITLSFVILIGSQSLNAYSQETSHDTIVLAEVPSDEVDKASAIPIEKDEDLERHFRWLGIRGDFNYGGIVGLTAGSGIESKRLQIIVSGGVATAGKPVQGYIAKVDTNYSFYVANENNFYISGKYYRMFVANQQDMNFVELGIGAQSKQMYVEIGVRSYTGKANSGYDLVNPLPSVRIGFKIRARK